MRDYRRRNMNFHLTYRFSFFLLVSSFVLRSVNKKRI